MTGDFETLAAAREILEKSGHLLDGMAVADYTRKVPQAFDASIGAHTRHLLDHFRNLVEAAESGRVDYDARRRDPLIESSPGAALQEIRNLLDRLEGLRALGSQHPLNVRCKVSYTGEAPLVSSTLGRELMFCVSHAIHHHAMVGMMTVIAGRMPPGDVGLAPSTVEYRREQ